MAGLSRHPGKQGVQFPLPPLPVVPREVLSVASRGFLRYRRGVTRSVRGWLPLLLLAGAARAGQVEFRAPRIVSYEIATAQAAKATIGPKWLAATPVGGCVPMEAVKANLNQFSPVPTPPVPRESTTIRSTF